MDWLITCVGERYVLVVVGCKTKQNSENAEAVFLPMLLLTMYVLRNESILKEELRYITPEATTS